MGISKTSFKFIFVLFSMLLLAGCNRDIEPPRNSLEDYLATNSDLAQVNALIACASGGQSEVFATETHPIAIFFLPEGNARDFRYFETDNIQVDNTDFSAYHETTLNDVPVFGGFLRYFERAPIQEERWSIVTYVEDDALHYSNPIRLKFPEKPTEFNPSLLTFDQSETLSPRFTWVDGNIAENTIYFHVVTDSNGELLSGTYTFDKTWQFYDLSNVVLNVRDVTPPPTLVPNQQYQYTMLAVSLDNWVNLLIQLDFDTF